MVLLLVTLALATWPLARWNRRLVLVGAASIYLSYAMIYTDPRSWVTRGLWTEQQLALRVRYWALYVLPLPRRGRDCGRRAGTLEMACDAATSGRKLPWAVGALCKRVDVGRAA